MPPVIEVDQTYVQQGKENSRLLSEYARQNGLEQPTYMMVPRQPKGEPALYSCVVKVRCGQFYGFTQMNEFKNDFCKQMWVLCNCT